MALALRSALLTRNGFQHGFFTRPGGVSRPPFDTLNFSTTHGDPPARVQVNLQRAAAELGVDPRRIYYLSQVHGCACQVLEGGEDRDQIARLPGDIVLSADPRVACSVRMADCPAVLIAELRTGVVAAVHSGWRGTVAGAVPNGVAAVRRLAARLASAGALAGGAQLLAAVGPHIERCCFEVGADVAAQLARASSAGDRVIAPSGSERAKPHVDLRQVIAAQLEDAGVQSVDHVRGCTVCDPARFFSYRRDGAVSGRMLGAIVARPARGRETATVA